MTTNRTHHDRGTADSVGSVPKQSRPPKESRSIRIRPWLREQVESICTEQQLTFNDAVERGLELWVQQQRQQ